MIKAAFGSLFGAVALATLLAAGPAVAQQTLTPRSVVAPLDARKLTYEVPNFRIGGKYDLAQPAAWADGGVGGTTLESLGAKPARTAYIAMGTPRRNAKGEIVNAIVINSYYSGDATAMYNNWVPGQAGNGFSGGPLVGPGLLFDTNRFYVVFVDALGLFGASKPSDGLGRKFPVYSYYDVVHLNYRMLRDHLKIGKVVLSTGVSMGATQSYYWGLMYPDFVQATCRRTSTPTRAWNTTGPCSRSPATTWGTGKARAGTRSPGKCSPGSPTPGWARTPAPTSPTWRRSSTRSTCGTATPSARSTTSMHCCPA
jgi:pimeloyl-ACP methyl ester carboxylesterase